MLHQNMTIHRYSDSSQVRISVDSAIQQFTVFSVTKMALSSHDLADQNHNGVISDLDSRWMTEKNLLNSSEGEFCKDTFHSTNGTARTFYCPMSRLRQTHEVLLWGIHYAELDAVSLPRLFERHYS